MARTINIEINQSFEQAYGYLQNPLNLSNWSSFFQAISQDELGLSVETPIGRCDLAFVAPNDYGVLDHVLRDRTGREYYNPMRAISYDGKTLLTFTTWSEESSELSVIEADLIRLKVILEELSND